MMDAELLQDAIGLLPEEMLAPVDTLRRKKRAAWKPLVAVAASLLLVVGIWQLQPISADNNKGMEDADEHAPIADRGDGYSGSSNYSEYSTSDNLYLYCINAKVTEVMEDYLVVALAEGDTAKVFFENMEEKKAFSVGAEIELWFDTAPAELTQLNPNDITIK